MLERFNVAIVQTGFCQEEGELNPNVKKLWLKNVSITLCAEKSDATRKRMTDRGLGAKSPAAGQILLFFRK